MSNGGLNATAFQPANTNCRLYLGACEIIWDVGDIALGAIFNVSNGWLSTINCSVWMTNGASGCSIMAATSAASVDAWYSRGTIFEIDSGATTPQFVRSTMEPGDFDFEDNWFNGIGATAYAGDGSINAQAEFESLVDMTGIYDVDPGFKSVTDLTPVGLARTTINILDSFAPFGVNNKKYSGHYGAYQYPTSGRGRLGLLQNIGALMYHP